jgi:hypothetical protein
MKIKKLRRLRDGAGRGGEQEDCVLGGIYVSSPRKNVHVVKLIYWKRSVPFCAVF